MVDPNAVEPPLASCHPPYRRLQEGRHQPRIRALSTEGLQCCIGCGCIDALDSELRAQMPKLWSTIPDKEGPEAPGYEQPL